MKIEFHHESGLLGVMHGSAVPRVGDKVTFDGELCDTRRVVSVAWAVYAPEDRGVCQCEVVRVYVE